MAVGITDRLWDVADIVALLEAKGAASSGVTSAKIRAGKARRGWARSGMVRRASSRLTCAPRRRCHVFGYYRRRYDADRHRVRRLW